VLINQSKKTYRQSGQTMIETIVAIYIMTMALASGIGLAIYATSQSALAKNQIIATNLAREGVEVIRMMRDTNWLRAEDDAAIADLTTCTYPSPLPTRPCYPETFSNSGTLGSQFELESRGTSAVPSPDSYRVTFRPSTGWALERDTGLNVLGTFFLCLQADGTYQHNGGLFGNSPECTGARFARKVSVTTGSTSSPFTAAGTNPTAAAGHSPEKIVTSTVVWQGRNCTQFPTTSLPSFNPETFSTKCKIQIVERLSNWKDYR
jgi:type II secretory pathway pseudopilin PulG